MQTPPFHGYLDLIRRARRKPLRFLIWKAGNVMLRRIRRQAEILGRYRIPDRRFLALLNCRTLEEALARFLNPERVSFFVSPEDRTTLVAVLGKVLPDEAEETVRRAEAVLRHEFDLLGSGPTSLGPQIDWHQDFKTGRRWPVRYHADIDYNNLDDPSDVKVPWELSRGHQFVLLGRAFWLTGDERYLKEFVTQAEDWIAQNPVGFGINWACTMEVAIRAVNWIWAAFLFHAADLPERFRFEFLRVLYQHGRFILNHLEISDVNGNHYLANGTGLLYLGLLFRGTAEGERWLAKGREIVHGEMFKQVLPDGVDFEMATAYHRLVTELFLSPILWELRAGLEVPGPILERLELMLEFVCHYTRPDGTSPNFGDADDGRLHILGNQSLLDHRYLLSTGAVLFKRGDFKSSAGRFFEESLWLLGPEGFEVFDSLPGGDPPGSRAFPEGGFYIMREGPIHLIVDCGDVGLKGRGGHGHNDILSFELSIRHPVIVDSGAFVYTADWQWKERFRSTAFHNGVSVDDEEIARLGGKKALWTIQPDARPILHEWESTPEEDRFVGEHTGYQRLSQPVRHVREISLRKREGYVRIHDRLTGPGLHRLRGFLHLHPEVSVLPSKDAFLLMGDGRPRIRLVSSGPPGVKWSKESGWYCPSYGVKMAAPYLLWKWEGDLSRGFEITVALAVEGDWR